VQHVLLVHQQELLLLQELAMCDFLLQYVLLLLLRGI